MTPIKRSKAQELIDGGNAVVIETLPESYFNELHLPHAINIPLNDEFDSRVQEAVPDQQQAILVYCLDAGCDASSKAAERLDRLGYTEVYDYEAGKLDWQDAGLPVESSR